MKILVTGSNGLLGQKLTEIISKDPQLQLIATSKGDNRFAGPGDFEYSEMDIRDSENVFNIFNQFKPDAVIHTAAMTNVDLCENKKEECW